MESLNIAQRKGHHQISLGDAISALAKNNEFFKKILINFNLKPEDIENLTRWLESWEEDIEKEKRFWEYQNLAKKGSMGRDFAAGYTITLDQFSTDWTKVISKKRVLEKASAWKKKFARLKGF